MNKNKQLLIFYFFFAVIGLKNAFSQQLLSTLPVAAKFLRTTTNNNTYIVSENSTIHKLDTNGKIVTSFRHSKLGNIDNLDVANPFKLMAFYDDFQTLVFFDKNLNVLNELNLRNLNLTNISAAALFTDNQILVFDDNEKKLKIIDFQGVVRRESQYLENTISTIIFQNKQIIAYSPDNLVFSFDFALQARLLLTDEKITDIETLGDAIFIHHKKETLLFDDSQELLKNISFPYVLQPSESVYFSNHRFFILNTREIKIFAF
jgi:hypothetical protein